MMWQVHRTDPDVLMYPIFALGGASAVGAVAVCIHKASGG